MTTSYFEWVQDRHGYFWEEAEVNKRLEAKMCEAFDDVLQTSVKYKTDMRTAAYIVAINRVATVTKMRGHVRVIDSIADWRLAIADFKIDERRFETGDCAIGPKSAISIRNPQSQSSIPVESIRNRQSALGNRLTFRRGTQ